MGPLKSLLLDTLQITPVEGFCSDTLSAMTNISEQISQLAEEYDESQEADKGAVRALAQGLIAGGLLRQSMLKVAEVETPKDENGDYLHHIVAIMESGIRVRITVEAE